MLDSIMGSIKFLQHYQCLASIQFGYVIFLKIKFLQKIKLRKSISELMQLVLRQVNKSKVLILVKIIDYLNLVVFEVKDF